MSHCSLQLQVSSNPITQYTQNKSKAIIGLLKAELNLGHSKSVWRCYSQLFSLFFKLKSMNNTVYTLQDFTILPTEKFRRCVIRSSSMIFLPTSSPTDYVRRLSLRRWFPIPSLYRSEKQKNHLPMVLQTEFARQNKKIPAWNIPTDF